MKHSNSRRSRKPAKPGMLRLHATAIAARLFPIVSPSAAIARSILCSVSGSTSEVTYLLAGRVTCRTTRLPMGRSTFKFSVATPHCAA